MNQSAAHTTPASPRRPRYTQVVMSVALVLFLLGFFGLLLIQAGQLSQSMKEKVALIIELNDGLDEAARDQLSDYLQQQPYYKAGSLVFTDKDEALRQLSEEFGEDILRLDLPNPLYDIYTFNVPAAYLTPDSLSQIQALLKSREGVADVYFQESLSDRIALNFQAILWGLLGAGLLLTGLAALLIHSVVRLSLSADRFIIKTQELVGASWAFITKPYLRAGLYSGALSALLAIGGLALAQWWMEQQLPELRPLRNWLWLGGLAALLLALGMGVHWLSTYSAVRRYLRLRVDDLY
jgi:cell division transport system permease protein